ncbi:MAG: ligand-binding SRPBCC domain-containing protein [Planctomycetaceae bacterium]|jgi:ligand-binding SRPBCC domain-containing protein
MIKLRSSVDIRAPIERCFDIARSVDVHKDTSTLIRGRAIAGKRTGLSDLGDETTWSARFFGLRFKIRTRVTRMVKSQYFCERRVSGLIERFEHDYHFTENEGSTRMEDVFSISLPLGLLGQGLLQLVLRPKLERVQMHRLQAIQQICEGDKWRQYLERKTPAE